MLTYVQRYVAEHHRAPVIREIQAGCQIVSSKSVIDRLNALERKGFIRRTLNRHRGIRVVARWRRTGRPPVESQAPVGTSSVPGTSQATAGAEATVPDSRPQPEREIAVEAQPIKALDPGGRGVAA